MTIITHNSFGKINIAKRSIAKVAAYSALDCYGVMEILSRSGVHNNADAKHKYQHRGVKVNFVDNKIVLHLYVVLKYGVNIPAVSNSIKESVKYKVEAFTRMLVSAVHIHVVGVGV